MCHGHQKGQSLLRVKLRCVSHVPASVEAEGSLQDSDAVEDEKGSSTPNLGLPAIPPTEDESDSGSKEKSQSAKPAPSKKPEDDFDDLAKRFEALKKR